ncbi:MAG: nuclear transport factor 2 family protein [Acidimicrobiia bacterium]|nr:nuclear transport factor 2 family protein [Acidimicrobiia bacterium]
MGGDLRDAMDRFQQCIESRDAVVAETVLDADYALVLVQPERAVMPRRRWLDVLPEYVVHEYAVEEEIVEVAGDLAVVLHRDRMRATVVGSDRSGTFAISDVWRRIAGDWRIWRRHSTPLSAGPLPGVQPS